MDDEYHEIHTASDLIATSQSREGFVADPKNPTNFIATSVSANHEIAPDRWLGETNLDRALSINMIEPESDFEYTKMKRVFTCVSITPKVLHQLELRHPQSPLVFEVQKRIHLLVSFFSAKLLFLVFPLKRRP